MGYSTKIIDIKTALKISSTKEVTEASDITYFGKISQISNRIQKAEISDTGFIIFTLFNGDFVKME